MITASAISFGHGRLAPTKVGQEYKVEEVTTMADLPLIHINSISVSKQAQKVYYPYDNTKSVYQPLGMVGPVVRLIGGASANSQSLFDDDRVYTLEEYQLSKNVMTGLYTNDILTVKAFGFPTWNATLSVGSQWWVDTVDYKTKSGSIKEGKVKYEIELNLYKRY